MKPLLVIIGGPTGIGKTAVAIELAKKINTEIISADSRQLFKEISIGTAIPSEWQLKEVKHHFIQSHSVNDAVNASRYETEVIQCLHGLFKDFPVVIMVGGSGLYIDAVCNGIDSTPDIPSGTREKFTRLFQQKGLPEIRQLLKEADPDYYSQVDLNNHSRILKALEIHDITGKPYSSFLTRKPKHRDFKVLKLILDIDRKLLYERINQRVDSMVESGLEEEARGVYELRHLRSLNTVGYSEWFDFFDGIGTRQNAIEQIKNHSRAYARKQLTWFRRYKDAHWFNPEQTAEMLSLIQTQSEAN